ncbi:K(+)-transporting ATPase subunit F [Curvibacter sp. HBC61]|uniref:K(+)-transporting ATPase subunit F n=1 Tax=Curvibacter cyanobacteriorum TaxID=3026422 RepID=A0ABT5MY99_9BURK|nr:K(+)-transporting ATPase subunit F [Curvibacter sp. HBC61]MDD0838783.1 K(+)-transporting ATPase subunit F [Curvibacter sp. HBC61]
MMAAEWLYSLGGLIAIGLLAYLVCALLRAEEF